MGDHEFHGTVSVQAATASDHAVQKTQLDTEIGNAKARGSHTGTQVMSTISDAQSYVDGRISTVLDIGGAPAALDTLNELAAALGDDANFSATITTSLGSLDTRIDALEAAAGTGIYKTLVGDAVLSSFTITHGLGTLDVDVTVRRVSDGQRVFPVDKAASTNTVTLDFGSFVPSVDSHRVIIDAK